MSGDLWYIKQTTWAASWDHKVWSSRWYVVGWLHLRWATSWKTNLSREGWGSWCFLLVKCPKSYKSSEDVSFKLTKMHFLQYSRPDKDSVKVLGKIITASAWKELCCVDICPMCTSFVFLFFFKISMYVSGVPLRLTSGWLMVCLINHRVSSLFKTTDCFYT